MNPEDYQQNQNGGVQNPNQPYNFPPNYGGQNYNPQVGDFQNAQNPYVGAQNYPQNSGYGYSQNGYPVASNGFEQPSNAPQFAQNPNNAQFQQANSVNLPSVEQQVPPQQAQQVPQPNNYAPENYSATATENPYTIDYLNKIAPPEEKPFWTPAKKIIVIMAPILIIISVIFMMIMSNKQYSDNELFTEMLYNFKQMRITTESFQKKLPNNIAALNSGLNSALASDEVVINDIAKKRGVKLKTDKKSCEKDRVCKNITQEYDELYTKLYQSHLGVTIKEVYPREIAYQLAKLRSKAKILKTKTSSKRDRDAFDEVIKHFDITIQQMEGVSKN